MQFFAVGQRLCAHSATNSSVFVHKKVWRRVGDFQEYGAVDALGLLCQTQEPSISFSSLHEP